MNRHNQTGPTGPFRAMNGSPDRVVGLVWIENMGHFVSYEQVLKTARANVR